jgi:hypothetical protein
MRRREMPGVELRTIADVVSFAARQVLDMFSPSNNPFTNPEVIAKAIDHWRRELPARPSQNWFRTIHRRLLAGEPPAGAEKGSWSGRDVAVTPGKVIFRNRLIELIQYSADDRGGGGGAGADRAGLDHEILHPRPVAGEFADPPSGRAGQDRLLHFLGQTRGRRIARSDASTTIGAFGCDGGARRRSPPSCPGSEVHAALAIAWAAR